MSSEDDRSPDPVSERDKRAKRRQRQRRGDAPPRSISKGNNSVRTARKTSARIGRQSTAFELQEDPLLTDPGARPPRPRQQRMVRDQLPKPQAIRSAVASSARRRGRAGSPAARQLNFDGDDTSPWEGDSDYPPPRRAKWSGRNYARTPRSAPAAPQARHRQPRVHTDHNGRRPQRKATE